MQQKWKSLITQMDLQNVWYETVPNTTGSWYRHVGGIWAKMKFKNGRYCYPSEIFLILKTTRKETIKSDFLRGGGENTHRLKPQNP